MEDDDLSWLEGLQTKGIRPGLESITELLRRIGDPHRGLKVIHVAGSDGKGSVCAMLESILLSAGFSTGMFVTPHVESVTECIRIDGESISGYEMSSLLGEIRDVSSECDFTNFEALTACAMLCFSKHYVDIAIVEVGMGGRLDATNVVEPVLTIINNISLEHTGFLGNTIGEIASEKAGIMKPGVPCVTLNDDEAFEVISKRSSEVGCPLYRVDPEEIVVSEVKDDSIVMRYGCETYAVRIPGRYQARNAALVIESLSHLDRLGHDRCFTATGLESVVWNDRMERVPGTNFISDVTHTRKGSECLAESIAEVYGKVTVVLGMLNDKDLDGVVGTLAPVAVRFLVSQPDSPRAESKDDLAEVCRRHHCDVSVFDTVGDAAEAAMKYDDMILVTGSFRTVEGFRAWLRRKM